MLVQAIYYICPIVECFCAKMYRCDVVTSSLWGNVTMTYFSLIFRHENSTLKIQSGSLHYKEEIKWYFRPFICPKLQYFFPKMSHGYMSVIAYI